MKTIYLMALIFMMSLVLFSQQEIMLNDLVNPDSLIVNDQNMYVVQDVNVFVYDLNGFKLKKKFGKAGEGPREFYHVAAPWIPSITLYLHEKHLFINSFGKANFYSKNGEFIHEIKTPGAQGRYVPLGDQYVLIKISTEDKVDYVVVDLVDEHFKKKKRIYRVPFPAQDGKKRNPIRMARMTTLFDRFSYKGKFVLPAEKGIIRIFDSEGNQIRFFEPPYTKVKVTPELAKRFDEFFMQSPVFKRPYINDKNRNLLTFGDYLPIFNYYRLADDKIYILSFFEKEGKFETFVYDFKGKLLKKIFLPLELMDPFNAYPFTIKDNTLYQLVSNDEEEEISVRMTSF